MTPTPPAAKRTTKRTVAASIVGGLALLVGALVGIDNWARQQVADLVTEKVQEVLSLDSDQPVTVNIAGVSMIAQVISGTIDEVDVGVDNVQIGELSGGVALTAEGIPIDLSTPVDEVQIAFTVGEKSIQSIAHVLSASAINSVQLVDDEIQFGSEFRVFGVGIDVGVAVEPFAADGEIGFTPTSVSLNGSSTSVASLKQSFGSAAASLLQTRSICVARWLPAALTVDSVEVDAPNLVVTIGADKEIFNDPALRVLGSCA